MKKVKTLLFASIISLIVIIAIILVLLNILKNNSNKNKQSEEVQAIKTMNYSTSVDEIYLGIKDGIDQYINYINNDINGFLLMLDEAYLKKNDLILDDMLDYIGSGTQFSSISEEYIKDKDIASIYKKLNLENKKIDFYHITDIEKLKEKDNIVIAKVEMIIQSKGKYEEYDLIFQIDRKNEAFSILPVDEYNENAIPSSIDVIADNIYQEKIITDKIAVEELFNNLKKDIQNTNLSYLLVDEEYKTKKFESINEFQKYINNMKNQINNSVVVKYDVVKHDNYTEYWYIDQYDNCYIFKAKSIVNYTVLYDDYTVIIESENEKYNKLSNKEKAQYCLNRLIKMIKDEDYKNAYAYINNSFKNNKFNTIERFKAYVEKNLSFIIKNNLISADTTEQEGVYTLNAKFQEDVVRGQNSEIKEITFLIKLKTETDFEVSFSF